MKKNTAYRARMEARKAARSDRADKAAYEAQKWREYFENRRKPVSLIPEHEPIPLDVAELVSLVGDELAKVMIERKMQLVKV